MVVVQSDHICTCSISSGSSVAILHSLPQLHFSSIMKSRLDLMPCCMCMQAQTLMFAGAFDKAMSPLTAAKLGRRKLEKINIYGAVHSNIASVCSAIAHHRLGGMNHLLQCILHMCTKSETGCSLPDTLHQSGMVIACIATHTGELHNECSRHSFVMQH